MYAFRFAGDMTHLLSILLLLLKIYATKSCSGISLKTQEYDTVMKIIFISSSLAIVWCTRRHRAIRRSYDMELDTFHHHLIVVACAVLPILVHEKSPFRK